MLMLVLFSFVYLECVVIFYFRIQLSHRQKSLLTLHGCDTYVEYENYFGIALNLCSDFTLFSSYVGVLIKAMRLLDREPNCLSSRW